MEMLERWGVFGGKNEKKDGMGISFISKLECRDKMEESGMHKHRNVHESYRGTALSENSKPVQRNAAARGEPQLN